MDKKPIGKEVIRKARKNELYISSAASMRRYEKEREERLRFMPASPWTKEESTREAREQRVLQAKVDFWYFDKTYFPPDIHQDYADPAGLHEDILHQARTPGIQWFLTGRDFAKTGYAIKILLWLHLRGEIWFSGTYAETIGKSKLLLQSIRGQLRDNPRIVSDFGVTLLSDSTDGVDFRTNTSNKTHSIRPFSPRRSPKSSNLNFARPQFLLGDDVETVGSPKAEHQIERRIKKIVEAWRSLTNSGTMLIMGNAYDYDSAGMKLLREQKEGRGREHIHLHPYPAWTEGRGSLWPARYKATTEAEMRAAVRATDDDDWAEYQIDPQPRGAKAFPRGDCYQEAAAPDDAFGVMWCDPNLSKKQQGDTTTMGRLLWSPATQSWYVCGVRCKSYSDPMQELDDYLAIWNPAQIVTAGFDGHVAQESSWSAFVDLWCQIRQRPYLPIEYRRYNVDVQLKTAQSPYLSKKVYFEPGFAKTEEGAEFLRQFHAFTTKAAGCTDDAADFFVCAMTLMFELRISGTQPYVPGDMTFREPLDY